jgi:hypothetical protein
LYHKIIEGKIRGQRSGSDYRRSNRSPWIRPRGVGIRLTTCSALALASMDMNLRERRRTRDESGSKRRIICHGEAKKENTYHY